MKDETTRMRYGGPSNKAPICKRCGKVDGHGIRIYSDEKTTTLARKLQQELDKVTVKALQRGYAPARKNKLMVGAAIATIGSRDYGFVTMSGADVEPLGYIGRNAFGKDVEIVRTIQSPTLNSVIGNAVKVLNVKEEDAERRERQKNTFTPGACCAQKLLMAIFAKKNSIGGKLTAISMSEILWRNSLAERQRSDYGSIDPVPSCETCKELLPLMLCDVPE